MAAYTIDILEPSTDLNASVDALGRGIGTLYKASWDKNKAERYGHPPFNLNVNALTATWFSGDLKIFIARSDATHEPLGFLAALVYRPMYYDGRVMHVQDWYTGGNAEMERDLFDYAMQAAKIIGCNELLVGDELDIPSDFNTRWEEKEGFTTRRFVKKV